MKKIRKLMLGIILLMVLIIYNSVVYAEPFSEVYTIHSGGSNNYYTRYDVGTSQWQFSANKQQWTTQTAGFSYGSSKEMGVLIDGLNALNSNPSDYNYRQGNVKMAEWINEDGQDRDKRIYNVPVSNNEWIQVGDHASQFVGDGFMGTNYGASSAELTVLGAGDNADLQRTFKDL